MIAGGHSDNVQVNRSVTLWAPQRKQCSLPSLPPSTPPVWYDWMDHTIDWVEKYGKLVACTCLGSDNNQCICVQFKSGNWTHLGNMTHERFYHTSAVIGNHVLLVGGASSAIGDPQNSTEYMSIENGTSIEGPPMVHARLAHCSIQVDSSTIILTGGQTGTDGSTVDSVVQYSELGVDKQPTTTELSPMKKARTGHACGEFKRSKGVWHDPEQVGSLI